MPLSELVLSLEPEAPADVRDAASRLRYRNLCLVALITDQPEPFPDNWIYLHDSAVTAGRVQNFGAWSPDMVQPGMSCLGVEYFCFEEDDIWQMSDDEAVKLATEELGSIGLIDPDRVVDGVKVRVPKAYPMYDGEYREAVAELRGYIESFDNLEPCGRNGLHRYNNQDHSMWTAVLAALNLLDGAAHNVWGVNVADEYLEETGIVETELGAELSSKL
jgi:protoporphyrinogen oxidase